MSLHKIPWEKVANLKKVFPSTLRTALWIIEMTVGVSFGILLLRYFGILPVISDFLSPVFVHFGLPGDASLAYVSGYFVNMYSAIAAAVSVGLDNREVTILGVMVLCSHNMLIETAVQKKTGSSAVRMVLIRTLSGWVLAFVLNLLLPLSSSDGGAVVESVAVGTFAEELAAWALETAVLVPKMLLLIFVLNILQAALSEFGVMERISHFLRPVMNFFGLSANCSVLWIIANTLGLAYGAAVMIEESQSGKIDRKEIDRLNTHIGISHSNLEDLSLLVSIGAMWWVLLLSRWMMSFLLVWGFRLEEYIVKLRKAEV